MNDVSAEEHSTPSDAALVFETLDGDREAFGQLVDRYKNLVMSFIAARVPADQVDDLGQETFLRGFRALHSLRNPARFSSWLLGIANHVCVDWHRSRRRPVSLDAQPVDLEEDAARRRPTPPRPDEAAEAHEAARRLLESLDQLPETYRITMVLKHMDGLSCKEIAEHLGVALGTVTSRLARGYQMLRDKLDDLAEAS
ncbi:MAG: RNA polymerase sigma factor [Planctomycetota bacterium]